MNLREWLAFATGWNVCLTVTLAAQSGNWAWLLCGPLGYCIGRAAAAWTNGRESTKP